MFGSQWFAAPSAAAYEISKSCIFDDAGSVVLTRTQVASPTNEKIWTFSCWIKRCNLNLANSGKLFGGYDASSGAQEHFDFSDGASNAADTLNLYAHNAGASGIDSTLTTNAVFRDTTAWYHLVVIKDTTQGTAANREKLYVNGVQQTFTGTSYPSEDFATGRINLGSKAQYLCTWQNTNANYDGYMAEAHFIDGTARVVGDFGETNDDGVWIPIEYTEGSYGNNGFYLDFADSGDLGDDESGNGNDFTETNLAAADQSTDTPTNNHCTWNSNFPNDSNIVLTEGNRNFSHTGGDQRSTIGTMFPLTGKWYFEVKIVSIGGSGPVGLVGIGQADVISQFDPGDNRHDKTGISLGYRLGDGQTYFNSSTASFGDSLTTNDILGIAWDADNGKCYFAKNNTWQNSGDPTSGATGTGAFSTTLSSDGRAGGWGPTSSNEASDVYAGRFAEAEWSYSPPTGYKAFCTASLEAPALKDPSTNFQAVTYSGTGSSNAITFGGNSDMQPDTVIIKQRNSTRVWTIYDAPRGVNKYVQLNEADAESDSSLSLTAFGSDGFTVGSGAWVNVSGGTFLGYGWSAGNSGASNTAGTINTTTTYSDSTAGISVSTYTGTGSAATIGHGLGVAPKLIMIKSRSGGYAWKVYHTAVASDPQTDYLVLNTNAAAVDDSTVWNDTAPTSTVFSIGTHADVNTNTTTYVAYAFAEVAGFSKFSIFTGDANANGPFIYTGFKPAWVMLKRTDSSDNWVICDNKRSTYNPAALRIYPDTNNADISSTTLDFLSSGFKMRASDGGVNGSGGTYVVAAFAESPFGGNGVAPATAR